MNVGMPSGDPPATPATTRTGIPGRVESALKAQQTPPPKGKGIVMMLLGVAVLGALIWDFSGRGAARRAVQESVDDGARPVPREAPRGATPQAGTIPRPLDAELRLPIRTAEGPLLELTPSAAAGLMASAPPADRAHMRRQILEALVSRSEARGTLRRKAFEAAAWFVEVGDEANADVVLQLTLAALPALADEDAAPAAILFLAGLPDHGGPLAATALDKVILDGQRPLAVRIAAAHARPADGRPASVRELASQSSTHPLLREALGKP